MTLKDRLVRIRKILGISQKELADRIGVRHAMIVAIESGRDLRSLPEIAQALDGLDAAGGSAMDVAPALLLARKTPVYNLIEENEGQGTLSAEPIGFLERPELLADAADSYGVLIGDLGLSPMLRLGEIALVRPGLDPAAEDMCVFRGDGRAAALAEYAGETEEAWLARRYQPEETVQHLKRSDWPTRHVIVGKHVR